jgi:hypothetical protein
MRKNFGAGGSAEVWRGVVQRGDWQQLPKCVCLGARRRGIVAKVGNTLALLTHFKVLPIWQQGQVVDILADGVALATLSAKWAIVLKWRKNI